MSREPARNDEIKYNDPPDDPREWTLMFFFGTDNNLAPSVISQFKGMKDAGFHQNVNVLVRYDPNEKGVPTRIFDVNRRRRERRKHAVNNHNREDPNRREARDPDQVGDGANSYIRNLDDDVITCPTETAKTQGLAPMAPEALEKFLKWCGEHRPAKHYMLFLIGHGMIVGNDAFLPDDNPGTSISLKELGETLNTFKGIIKEHDGALELVGMHSCSMSAIEVAYELQGKANYMMASEGISFIGTWPYRQLLKNTFNRMKRTPRAEMDEDDIKVLLEKLYLHCLHNSTDFKFAGYAADLCLCNLNKVEETKEPIGKLTQALKNALKTKCGQRLIQEAHMKSQSYWQENYTDLYDFCQCLSEQCDEAKYALCLHVKAEDNCVDKGGLNKIKAACDELKEKLKTSKGRGLGDAPSDDSDEGLDDLKTDRDKEESEVERRTAAFNKLVVFSEFLGPTYQYSHGLSVYFPWSRPIDPAPGDISKEELKAGGAGVLDRYKGYAFTTQLGEETSWLSFLNAYFGATQREPREVEEGLITPEQLKAMRAANVGGGNAGNGGAASTALPAPVKGTPTEAGGAGCTCGSIKNYSTEFLMPLEARLRASREKE